ncbi:substrate-binding periplasmic protein [Paracidovorax wautersii]|uniref:ABC-type amino acid transport substrate-binding protein n=1 Tax=Paracidovorax wautersii TaxID=1177982 RepID=A0A1I2GAQ3_9BURK|nr:ABC transporter substrate-binding protein [Paracidovorax wautersii]SFF14268.1 ABC-type amino acid transport substrate-binding protein [Paracidovorax wautersii]
MTAGRLLRCLLWAAACSWFGLCSAQPVPDGMPRSVLRICVWPDYFGSTYRDPVTGKLSGLDIDMAHELAASLKLPVAFIDTTPNTVAIDLASRRCDVSMSAWAVSAERKRRMHMATPHLRSDVYAVVNRGSPVVQRWEDIDRPGVVIGVVASSYFDTNISAHFRVARVVALPFSTVQQDLQAGRVDVFLTNFSVSEMMARTTSWARSIAPPTPVEMTQYAYATALDRPAWSDTVDRFVAAVREDGRLHQAAWKQGMEVMVIR